MEPLCLSHCAGTIYHHPGLKGKNADSTKLLFILHRPDERVRQRGLFLSDYEEALRGSKTGKTLFELLEYCGLSFDDIFLTNLFKCVLKGDRNPEREEYEKCKRVLEEQVAYFEPSGIVAFGSAVKRTLKPDTGVSDDSLFYLGRYPIFYTMHPSAIWALRNTRMIRGEYEKVRQFLSFLPNPS